MDRGNHVEGVPISGALCIKLQLLVELQRKPTRPSMNFAAVVFFRPGLEAEVEGRLPEGLDGSGLVDGLDAIVP